MRASTPAICILATKIWCASCVLSEVPIITSSLQPEGCLGYGYWVCHTLATVGRGLLLESDGVSLNQTARQGLLKARDCLQKYVGRCPGNVCAHNYLGLLFELEGLLQQAEKALSMYVWGIVGISWSITSVAFASTSAENRLERNSKKAAALNAVMANRARVLR